MSRFCLPVRSEEFLLLTPPAHLFFIPQNQQALVNPQKNPIKIAKPPTIIDRRHGLIQSLHQRRDRSRQTATEGSNRWKRVRPGYVLHKRKIVPKSVAFMDGIHRLGQVGYEPRVKKLDPQYCPRPQFEEACPQGIYIAWECDRRINIVYQREDLRR
jgi:hypothetical protein